MGSLTLIRDEAQGVLTDRQREILDFITRSIRERGYPPTLREIGLHFGIRSTNGVNDHLRALEKKGHLQREDLEISRAAAGHGRVSRGARSRQACGQPRPPTSWRFRSSGALPPACRCWPSRTSRTPCTSTASSSARAREVFALRVKGDSMIEDGIHDGDYIFVRKQLQANRGDTVVAMIGDEATVKRYYPEGDTIRFQPANARCSRSWSRSANSRA